MTIDTTNMCSHLQKKLFEPEGVYYPIWQAMQDDESKTIFHAGDLCNWYARFLADGTPEEEVFSEEIGHYINPVAEEKTKSTLQGWSVCPNALCHEWI